MAKIEFTRLRGEDKIPAALEELYMGAFPEEERRPVEQIRQRIAMADPFFYFFVLSHDDTEVGFITIWRLPGATYVEHFAIFPALRGKGYGADTVKELLNDDVRLKLGLDPGTPLVLEVELPEDSPEAARRIAFYERCGLTAMEEFPYYQPPYREGGPQVPMMLMSSKPLPDPTSFVILLRTIVYNQ